MKTALIKASLTLALVFALVFTACPEDDAGGIKVEDESVTGFSGTADVMLSLGNGITDKKIGSITDGKLSFELPDISDTDATKGETYSETGITVDPSSTKVLEAALYCTSGGTKYYLSKGSGFFNGLQYIYSDRDATVKGTMQEEGFSITFDLDLKSGWNTVYFAGTAISTTEPDTSNWKWSAEAETD